MRGASCTRVITVLTDEFLNDTVPVVEALAARFAVRQGTSRASVTPVALVTADPLQTLAFPRPPVALESSRAIRVTLARCKYPP